MTNARVSFISLTCSENAKIIEIKGTERQENIALGGLPKAPEPSFLQTLKNVRSKAPKSGGARRTFKYVAATRDEGNAGDGRFSAAC